MANYRGGAWFESTAAHHVLDLKFATERRVALCAALACGAADG
jgi:hypothetical protein